MLDYTIIAQYQTGDEVSWLSKIRNDGAEIALQEIIALYRGDEERLLGTPYHDPDEFEPWHNNQNHTFTEDRAFVILWCDKGTGKVENHVEVWYCSALEEKDRGFWVNELERGESGKVRLNCDAIDVQPIPFDFGCQPREYSGELVTTSACWRTPMSLTEQEEENDDWSPIFNFLYPLPSLEEIPDDWRSRLICTTIVEWDGDYYLALTGCGMDMSWEIAESYIALGYWPPCYIELPEMAGRGESDRDKAVIACCRESAIIKTHWMRRRVEMLDRMGCPYKFLDPRAPTLDEAETLAGELTEGLELDVLIGCHVDRLTAAYLENTETYLSDLPERGDD